MRLLEDIKIPDGLLLAYPVLDLNMSLFRPVNDKLIFIEITIRLLNISVLPSDIDRAMYKSKETPLRSYMDDEKIVVYYKTQKIN